MSESIMENEKVQARYNAIIKAAVEGNLGLSVFYDPIQEVYLPVLTQVVLRDGTFNHIELIPLGLIISDEAAKRLIPPIMNETEVN